SVEHNAVAQGASERWNGGTVERSNGRTVRKSGTRLDSERLRHEDRSTARLVACGADESAALVEPDGVEIHVRLDSGAALTSRKLFGRREHAAAVATPLTILTNGD